MKHKNIPKGYKDSPLGIIPKEWEVKTIGEVCDIHVGKDLNLNSYSKICDNTHIYPVYSNTVDANGWYGGYYNFEEYKGNCVTVVGRGVGLGTAFYRDKGFGAIGRLLVLYSDKCDAKYLTEYINGKVEIFVESAAIPQLTGKQIANYRIAVPPINEQKKIAEILSVWDEAIDKQTKLIDALVCRKRALMQQLLTGKKRLPSFTKRWETIRLGDIFTERNETHKDHLPLLSITAERGVILQSESDKKDISNNDKSKYKRICPNDIGYNTMRMWQGRSALSTMEGIVSPAYTIVTPKKNICPLFISAVFKHPRVIYNFWTHSQGLVNDTLNCKFFDFSQVKVNIPTYHEQEAIAEVLIEARYEIELSQKRLHQFHTQKHSLMQQLLTGKKRIKI